MKKWCWFVVMAVVSVSAHAARPFVTDDARLTTEDSCQLESWVRHYANSHEAWALPACNVGGNFEITAGAGQAKTQGVAATNDYIVQAKTLFRPLNTNDWGWGLAVGTVKHPSVNPGPNLLGNTYLYLPASLSLKDDAVVVHANLGVLRDHATSRHSATWGVGAEFRLTPRLLAIAESFGDQRHQPYWQVGGRYAIVPDRVQIDATVGEQFQGDKNSRWISFGLRLTPAQLF